MSGAHTENAPTEEQGLVVGGDPQAQMADLLNFLAPEESAEEGAEAPETGAPAADDAGQQPAGAEGSPGAEPPAAQPADGAAGQPEVPDDGPAPAPTGEAGGGDAGGPVSGVDAAELAPKWGEIATSFEENQVNHLHQAALSEVREEYQPYFDRITQHPRLLVGQEVQSLTGEGKEVLKDAADAREWQEAAKHLLVEEVQARVDARKDELADVFTTVHSSIDLFRNNADLVPGTKQFDKELADEFASMAKDYELRSGGKLVGYSVPVQPLINQIRSRLAARRSATPAPAPAAPDPARQAQAQAQARNDAGQWTGPQAGITSKAGSSGGGEDDVAAGLMDAFFRQNGFSI